MTREEAITILTETQVVYFAPNGKEKVQEALDMAIEALSDDAVGYETTVTINEPISIQSNYVHVVRCKDCRYCTEHYDRDGYPYWMCKECDGGTDADGYCHCGERREE